MIKYHLPLELIELLNINTNKLLELGFVVDPYTYDYILVQKQEVT